MTFSRYSRGLLRTSRNTFTAVGQLWIIDKNFASLETGLVKKQNIQIYFFNDTNYFIMKEALQYEYIQVAFT